MLKAIQSATKYSIFQLECCGNTSAGQWIPNTPPSCCKQGTDICTALVNSYTTDCSTAAHHLIQSSVTIFGSLALVIAGIQVCLFCIYSSGVYSNDPFF